MQAGCSGCSSRRVEITKDRKNRFTAAARLGAARHHPCVSIDAPHTLPLLQMHHGSGGAAALAALLALVAACGACDGLASGALYGEAAVLAPRYTQALATGNSLSGGFPTAAAAGEAGCGGVASQPLQASWHSCPHAAGWQVNSCRLQPAPLPEQA